MQVFGRRREGWAADLPNGIRSLPSCAAACAEHNYKDTCQFDHFEQSTLAEAAAGQATRGGSFPCACREDEGGDQDTYQRGDEDDGERERLEGEHGETRVVGRYGGMGGIFWDFLFFIFYFLFFIFYFLFVIYRHMHSPTGRHTLPLTRQRPGVFGGWKVRRGVFSVLLSLVPGTE